MSALKVKIKKLNEDAVTPTYSQYGDAGMDLTAISKSFDEFGNVVFGTGLAFEIPEGFLGLIFPRSSNAKQDLLLSNSVGVIDSGYRGEVMLKFKPSVMFFNEHSTGDENQNFIESNYEDKIRFYEKGDRIGQIIILPYPQIEFEEAEKLSETVRGNGGYGSTGK